jgi:serine protease Do
MKKLLLVGLVFLLSGCTYFEGFQVLEEPLTRSSTLTETDVNRLIQQYITANNLVPAGGQTGLNIDASQITIQDLDELTIDLVDILKLSVLGVLNKGPLGDRNGTGSAVIYEYTDNYYYAITNNHVIESATTIEVFFNESDFAVAELVGTDPESDLAVLRFQTNRTVYVAPIAPYESVRAGQIIIAIGSPSGFNYFNSVTMGMISGTDRFVGISDSTGDGFRDVFQKMLQHDAAINPGNSGGPIFNLRGEITGINTLKLVDSTIEGMGFSIPVDIITRVVNDLTEFGEVQRARLGVFVGDVRYANVETLISRGVFISDVIAGGAVATTSDMQVGDIITHMDGVRIEGLYMLRDMLFQYRPGQSVLFGYDRNGESRETTVILGQ